MKRVFRKLLALVRLQPIPPKPVQVKYLISYDVSYEGGPHENSPGKFAHLLDHVWVGYGGLLDLEATNSTMSALAEMARERGLKNALVLRLNSVTEVDRREMKLVEAE